DNVYVFTRGAHPVIVYDRNGKFLRSWGEDIGFTNAHGAAVGPDDMLYLTDDFGHAVRKCTTDGRIVLTIGTPKKPAPAFSGEPFNRCTHTALSPQGDIYVSDGYANARVHKYSPDGKLLFSWGEPGTDPGQFNLVSILPATTRAGSMSPIAKIIGCRSSTATASMKRNGTISCAPAASALLAAKNPLR